MAVARKKTTVYLDPDLVRSVKVLAASTGRHDYEVVEEALRQYLDRTGATSGRDALVGLLDEVSARVDLTDDEALDLAYTELHEARRARRT